MAKIAMNPTGLFIFAHLSVEFVGEDDHRIERYAFFSEVFLAFREDPLMSTLPSRETY